MRLLTFPLAFSLLAQTVPHGDSTIEFENHWVRIVRVQYTPYEKTELHDHPALPTVYVYVTDGGRLKIGHEEETSVIRPPVRAGGIRFQKGVSERHTVEELDGIASEYLRVELKIKPVDLPSVDVRRAPGDRTSYESGMIRILRVTCAARSTCPASLYPENPAVVIAGKTAVWMEAGAAPAMNQTGLPIEQVRIELKTLPR